MTSTPNTGVLPAAAHAEAFCASGSSPTDPSPLPPGVRDRITPDGASGAIDFEIVGPAHGELAVVLGGISAGRHVTASRADPTPGWWEPFAGEGRTLDTRERRLLSIDYSSEAEAAGTAEQAERLAALLTGLGVERLPLLIGASYGGMVGLAFAAAYPERLGRLLLIGAAHRTHPMATAWRALQRRIVELGVESGDPERAVGLARGLAMTTYRSAREFEERFEAAPSEDDGEREGEHDVEQDGVEHYLAARGRSFAAEFAPETFARLSAAIDDHRVDPARVTTPVDLIAIESDALVPPWLVEELHGRLAGPSRLRRVDSKYGHDAFLVDEARLGPVLEELLAGPGTSGRTASPVTRAVRAGIGVDREHGAVMPPLHLSANFTFEGLDRKRRYDYTRTANPTRDLLADAIADLEGAAGAVVTSSGMSAVALVFQLLRPDDLVVITDDCYGGTHRLASKLAERGACRVRFADLTTPEGIVAAARLRPRLIWVETPSNPLLRITDLAGVCRAARECGALVAVDNTFLSPALQRPLEHGVDLVAHSTTKFLNGHSDVVGGAVAAADPALVEELAWWANCLGLGGSPFDAYLTLRGLRTLGARVRVHQDNALAVAQALLEHDAVERVHYPGLPGHPGGEVAARQQLGWGSLLSFELRDGRVAVEAFVDGLRHFALAESLGGVESLVAHPATMTHAAMEPAARAAAGIGDALLRLSVGIEAREDLVADVRRGLDCAAGVR